MRRMYSVQELSEIISAVVGQKIEDGSFDEVVAGAVDDYLTEHPVDITALEGLDISVGSLDADGLITGGEIIEKMSGYSFVQVANYWTPVYCGIVKNGNKLTFVVFGSYTYDETDQHDTITLGNFKVPSDIFSKLYPYEIGVVSTMLAGQKVQLFTAYNNAVDKYCDIQKGSNNQIQVSLRGMSQSMTDGTEYFFRIEQTFLLSDNLAE